MRRAIYRVLLTIPTLFGVLLVSFLLLQAVPGDPAAGLVGERADPALVNEVRVALGLDKPAAAQFFYYLRAICGGDLGRSYYTREPVGQTLLKKFPNTLKLAVAAMALSVFFGLAMGMVSAARPNSAVDRVFGLVSAAGISTPVFWLGLMLIVVFGTVLRWLPVSGTGGLEYLVLPAVTLAARSVAYVARLTRSSMLEVLGQNFILAARARGVPAYKVVAVHALRNSLLPVVTLVGLDFGSYLNGSVLTETIFGWDGIGRYAVEGIMRRDYPVILGTVLFGASVFVVVNLMVDLIYVFLDPRVRREQ